MEMLIQITNKHIPLKQLSRLQMKYCNENLGLPNGSTRQFVTSNEYTNHFPYLVFRLLLLISRNTLIFEQKLNAPQNVYIIKKRLKKESITHVQSDKYCVSSFQQPQELNLPSFNLVF